MAGEGKEHMTGVSEGIDGRGEGRDRRWYEERIGYTIRAREGTDERGKENDRR